MLIPVWFCLGVNVVVWAILLLISLSEKEEETTFDKTFYFILMLISMSGCIFLKLHTSAGVS